MAELVWDSGSKSKAHGFRCNEWFREQDFMPPTSHDSRVGGTSTPKDVCREKPAAELDVPYIDSLIICIVTSPVQNYLQFLLNLALHKRRPLDLSQQVKV